jgi:hypothetical protein
MAIQIGGTTVIDNSRKFIPVTVEAGGGVGSSGQVLSSTGTGIQWITPASGFAVTDDTTTDATYYVGYATVTSGVTTTFGISTGKLTFNPSTGNFSATIFTSLSDITQKTNIRPIENSIELTKELQGVRFDWVDNNKPSLGLIAQEVEKVLPELIETGDDGLKRVNYSNMIGLLIEAIKEQQVRIEELEEKVNA